MTCSRNRRWLALVILCLGIAPCFAHATCLKWDVGGAWTFAQANDTSPRLQLQQQGDQISGSASYSQQGYPYKGSIDGRIDGDKMQLTVYWDHGAIGVYNAKINSDGSLEGGTYDKREPENYATWNGDRKANCTLTSARPLGADGRPAMALGRVKHVPAATQCPRWNVAAIKKLTQSGRGAWIEFNVRQAGANFEGDASYFGAKGTSEPYKITGRVVGSISGDEIKFTATWPDNTSGIYYGSISPVGRITGYTYQQDEHGTSADWSSVDRATCDAGPPAERTGLQLGRVMPRNPSAPTPSICDAARSARSRNSPAAPGLEARCRALGETTNVPISTRVDRSELDRLAEIGHAIARTDYSVGNVRRANSDLQFRFGFDVASALFGDPALGGQGNTTLDPGSLNIRASLDPASQPGFDESANFHLGRNYGP